MGLLGLQTSLTQHQQMLKRTPLFLVALSSDVADALLPKLVRSVAQVTVRKHKALRPPKGMDEHFLAVCCSGTLASPGSASDASSWSRKAGDFWFVIPGAPALVATTFTRVLCLPRSAWWEALAVVDDPFVRKLASLDFISVLTSVPYFSTIDTAALSPLAALFSFECFPAHATVYSAGEVSNKFYILVHGQVSFTLNGEVVKHIDTTTFFGATAFVGQEIARVCTVTCGAAGCALLSLHREHFELFKEHFGEAAALVLGLMRRETRGRMVAAALQTGGLATAADVDRPTHE
jgi:hypothetical protein